MMFASASASAGHYTVSYSGGTATSTTSGGTSQSSTYSLNGNGYWGGTGTLYWSSYHPGGSASCSGAITTAFTWVRDTPDDDPPQAVVIREECNVGVSASSANAPETANNDLGFPQVQNGSSTYSQGVRYQIKQNPGDDFTLTCSPSATLGAATTSYGYGYASVSYKADANPLDLILSGGIGTQKNKRYLIGQLCTASLVTGGLPASNFNWSVTGGDPFSYWLANRNLGEVGALDLTQEHGSSLLCYFKKPDSATVTCTFDLAIPVGALPFGGFPGLTLTKQAGIEPPDNIKFDWQVFSMSFNPAPPAIPTFFGLVGTTLAEYPGAPIGIVWVSHVTTPADYVTTYGGDKGGWNYVQLVTPGLSQTMMGTDQTFTLNGVKCLDSTYPYSPQPFDKFPGNPGKHPGDGMDFRGGDGPGMPLSNNLSKVQMNNSFRTWLMYLPPGSDSCYVPLRKLKWYCNGTAIRTGPDMWQRTTPPNDRGVSQEGTDYPPFPVWTRNVSDGHF